MSNFKCQIRPEEKILILCGRTGLTEANKQQLEQYLNDPVDFRVLIANASRLQIPYLLYNALKNFKDYVPPDVLEKLKQGYFNNLGRSLKIFEEYKNLVKLFSSEGIEVVPLKGPVFAEVVYGSMGLRPTSDMDVFVRERDLERARELVIKDGYKERGGDEKFNLGYARKYLHHLEFSKEVYLELHWTVCRFDRYKLPPTVFWDDVQHYKVQGEDVLCLSPEGSLLQQLYHGLESNFFKTLVDVSVLLKCFEGQIDWQRFNRKIGMGNLRNAAIYFLKAAHDFLGAPVDFSKLKHNRTLRNLLAEQFFPPQKMIFSHSRFLPRTLTLLLVDHWRDSLGIAREHFLPSNDFKQALNQNAYRYTST